MHDSRTVEDYLRSEYAGMMPALQRTLLAAETEIRSLLLAPTLALQRHERIAVRSRLKECESAIDSLRRRQPWGMFDANQPRQYSLRALPDLVGIRVLTFPQQRLEDARNTLSARIAGWISDDVPAADPESGPIALKYSGRWKPDDPVNTEVQIVPLLVGLFWEVEHAAIYKPSPNLRGVAQSLKMKQKIAAVETALREFETEFGHLIETLPDRG